MKSTPGQFTIPILSGQLRKEHLEANIYDSHSALGIYNILRKNMLKNFPFFLAELVNTVTRLSQQGLVNPDIKADNFVIDGSTGRPSMIDLNIILPSGHRD